MCPSTPQNQIDVHADAPLTEPPRWAVLERQLIDRMNEAVEPLLQKYVRADGSILWPPDESHVGIDGLDDAYESFHNWPLFYMVGGHDKLLRYSQAQFDAITAQFERYPTGQGYPMVVDEYQPAYDWFHQGEGNLFFYLLCMADSAHADNRARLRRFAGFYTNENPRTPNYDPNHRIIRCAHNGSVGPAFWNFHPNAPFPAAGWGLPFYDVPGVKEVADLDDPKTMRRYARIVNDRRGRGDTAVNLAATSLSTLAFAMTGEEEYRQWVQRYVEAWIDRARANGGVMPDNVGLDGTVGSHMNGNWYGANYGWTHPHGWRSVGQAIATAAQNATLLTGDRGWLELLRSQIDELAQRGVERDGQLFLPHRFGEPGHVHYRPYPFLPMLRNDDAHSEPKHRGDWANASTALEHDGWFDFQPLNAEYLAHLWICSMQPADLQRQVELAPRRDADVIQAWPPQGKDQGGWHAAWLAYLRGEYASYPQDILAHNLDQVSQRLERMEQDTQDPADYNDAYLQRRNPITMEGLVTLTMGGPLPIYNGGMPMTRLRHYDIQRQRPGLPADVAALVVEMNETSTVIELCNLASAEARELEIQAGAFGEHRFTVVQCEVDQDGKKSAPSQVDRATVRVRLEPRCRIRLRLGHQLFVGRPACA